MKEHVSAYAAAYHSIPEHDEIRMTLRKLMWDRVGIIRCGESLEEARKNFQNGHSYLTRSFTQGANLN